MNEVLNQAWSLSNYWINTCQGVAFMKYVVFSWTCVSSGTALVPSLTTSERWEVWEVLGLEPLNYNKHGFLKRNLPEKGLSPLVLPDDKSGGFRIGLILTCMACFLPSHEYSLGKLLWCDKALMFTRNHPALPLIIKAVGEHIRRNIPAWTSFLSIPITDHSSLVMLNGQGRSNGLDQCLTSYLNRGFPRYLS